MKGFEETKQQHWLWIFLRQLPFCVVNSMQSQKFQYAEAHNKIIAID